MPFFQMPNMAARQITATGRPTPRLTPMAIVLVTEPPSSSSAVCRALFGSTIGGLAGGQGGGGGAVSTVLAVTDDAGTLRSAATAAAIAPVDASALSTPDAAVEPWVTTVVVALRAVVGVLEQVASRLLTASVQEIGTVMTSPAVREALVYLRARLYARSPVLRRRRCARSMLHRTVPAQKLSVSSCVTVAAGVASLTVIVTSAAWKMVVSKVLSLSSAGGIAACTSASAELARASGSAVEAADASSATCT